MVTKVLSQKQNKYSEEPLVEEDKHEDKTCFWYRNLCLKETFFLWKLASLTKFNRNLLVLRKIYSLIYFCWNKLYYVKKKILLWQLLYSVTEICFVKKIFFGQFIYDFQGKVSVRIRIFHNLRYPRYPLCGALTAQTLPDATQTKGKIYSISKIAIIFEPVMRF